MKRREFIKNTILGVGALSLQSCGGGNKMGGGMLRNTSAISPQNSWQKPLPIPQLLTGTSFNLTAKTASHNFFDGYFSPTYCVDDGSGNTTYLAPTLKVENGANINITYNNNLTENITMHAHGMHVPSNMDGNVNQIITPNSNWSINYTINQKSCTNWYHSHLMGATAQHTYKGLSGLMIVEDSESLNNSLPKEYGVDDIPLIIQDKIFDSNGNLQYTPTRMDIMRGFAGDIHIVNGVYAPKLSVAPQLVRFRLLNAANARVYKFSLSGKTFTQIATDNAFLESGVALTELILSPAERAEIVFDFSAFNGQQLSLTDVYSGVELLQINVDKTNPNTPTLPSNLTTLTKFAYDSSTPTRTFTLGRERGMSGNFTINGVSMDKNAINQSVPIDTVEIWEVINPMRMTHNFHIHATHFWIIERNGNSASVPANEQGYKDTVRIDANSSVKFVVKMTDYKSVANNPYMYHCHILEHEDGGMMGQFSVV